jgi:hypothetical protein
MVLLIYFINIYFISSSASEYSEYVRYFFKIISVQLYTISLC